MTTAKQLAVKAQAPLEPATLTPSAMLAKAVTSGADVAVIEKLMGLQERWEANQARKAYNEAIALARSEIPVILKGHEKTGAGGSYKYETLGDIANTVDPILARHGLSYRYQSESNGDLKVTCVITHTLGHSESNSLSAKPSAFGSSMNAIQALGSAVTYLQRYTLKLALGIATAKDDDGVASGQVSRGSVPLRPHITDKDGVTIDAETGELVDELPGMVTPSQRDQLIKLADDLGIDKAAFCKYFNIQSLADVPAAAFDKARDAMLKADKRRAK